MFQTTKACSTALLFVCVRLSFLLHLLELHSEAEYDLGGSIL